MPANATCDLDDGASVTGSFAYDVGGCLRCVSVLKLLDFGAIVSVLPGKDGLLHISQIAEERVNAVGDIERKASRCV